MQFQRTDTGFLLFLLLLFLVVGGFLVCLFLFNEKKLNNGLGKQREVPENKGLRKNCSKVLWMCLSSTQVRELQSYAEGNLAADSRGINLPA